MSTVRDTEKAHEEDPVHPLLIVYAAVCLFIGVLGANRTMGFWGYFFASAVFTPIVGFIMMLISRPLERRE